MSDKTLVERLRDGSTANGTCTGAENGTCASVVIRNLLDKECESRYVCTTCRNCINETMNKLADAIEREYLPRPRFEDDEPVQFGDMAEVRGDFGDVTEILYQDGKCVEVGLGDDGVTHYMECDGEHLKRLPPEQYVLDADGVQFHTGDTVWNIDSGRKYTVYIPPRNHNEYRNVGLKTEEGAVCYYDPSRLTHKQPPVLPVLDADGVQINVGDTVYVVEKNITTPIGNKEVVESIEHGIVYTDQGGWDGTDLSHKEPDSLARIEEDAKLDVCVYYAGRDEHKCDGCRGAYCFECKHEMTLDLLRRQREVLERGNAYRE